MFVHLFKDKTFHHKDSKALENITQGSCAVYVLEIFKSEILWLGKSLKNLVWIQC